MSTSNWIVFKPTILSDVGNKHTKSLPNDRELFLRQPAPVDCRPCPSVPDLPGLDLRLYPHMVVDREAEVPPREDPRETPEPPVLGIPAKPVVTVVSKLFLSLNSRENWL